MLTALYEHGSVVCGRGQDTGLLPEAGLCFLASVFPFLNEGQLGFGACLIGMPSYSPL